MTDLEKDDTSSGSTTGERKARQKRILPKPLLRLLVMLAVIVIVVVVVVFAVRSATRSGDAADYQRYMNQVSSILQQSDSLGSQLVDLLTNPGDTTRGDIQARLDQFVATSERLELDARNLKAPTEFIKQNVQQFFILVMTFRHTGLADLKPSLMNALEVTDTEVSSEPISRSLYYLTNSDFLYREVFIPKAREILDAKNLKGVTIPSTEFLTDPDIASKSRAQEILAQLKSTGNLQAVHGVELAKVVAQPDDKEITAGGTFNLQSSDSLSFVVTVENQGNMSEKDVPIKVSILSPDSTQPQTVTVSLPELKPKEKADVEVKGLNPAPYGEVAVLTVEAGPVSGEKTTDNNSIKANVIFTL